MTNIKNKSVYITTGLETLSITGHFSNFMPNKYTNLEKMDNF